MCKLLNQHLGCCNMPIADVPNILNGMPFICRLVCIQVISRQTIFCSLFFNDPNRQFDRPIWTLADPSLPFESVLCSSSAKLAAGLISNSDRRRPSGTWLNKLEALQRSYCTNPWVVVARVLLLPCCVLLTVTCTCSAPLLLCCGGVALCVLLFTSQPVQTWRNKTTPCSSWCSASSSVVELKAWCFEVLRFQLSQWCWALFGFM